ncbi:hypothetical protein O181_008624 [Austropuccinia psidii MF-1]|uniref:Uncharacterized protein n=1 Tax=Austropuccinia psidii MF-1 TaxID=1389203 RepID=A0A9Q3GJ16_9BASI|nr:hypothetical protein [Austropuccinia psidii MF-1]
MQRNQPEERTGLFRSRRSGFGQNGELQDTERDYFQTPIHHSIQQRPQDTGLDRHGLSMSACDSKPEHKHDSQNTINQWFSQDTTKTWNQAKLAQKVSNQRGNSPLPKYASLIIIGQIIAKLFLLKAIAEHKP